MTFPTFTGKPVPARAGIGLRSPHFDEVLTNKPEIGFLEIHTENFFSAGGPTVATLEKACELYPMSFHGVSLSLGSTEEPNKEHLAHVKQLVDHFNPGLISEHISWSVTEETFLNSLIPLPYTAETVNTICKNIDIVQNTLGRQILMENPSAYLKYNISETELSEGEFITEITKRTGCGLLLDVNNVYVSAKNMGDNPEEHLMSMPFDKVEEIHLAGHCVRIFDDKQVLIDSHNNVICDAVWNLYKKTIEQTGSVPSLIEWDLDIPPLQTLLDEAAKAQTILDKVKPQHAA